MTIRILPEEIASQIAAGEVVERPASVVKELIENSLDAGAGHVVITVDQAGKGLIEVADDGVGIPAEELPLAVARHATSKLTIPEDLFKINSLGFRGEALSSIGSVSRLTVTSRQKDADVGMRLVVEAGVAQKPESVGVPAGTVVRVEDLFKNVPARLKFLKTDRTERRHIDDLVTRYAMAYPNVRFQLRQEGRISLKTSGNDDRREVMAALYGVDTAQRMIQVLAEHNGVHISGLISPPDLTRSNRREITIFVNGRPVQDAALTTAVLQGYHTILMTGRFPIVYLFLKMPPDEVDVNVHPTKAEVRFRDRDLVFRGIGRAVRRALLAHAPVPGLHQDLRWSLEGETRSKKWDPAWELARDDPEDEMGLDGPKNGGQPSLIDKDLSPILRLVGQVASSYLVAEGPDGLYLIDQHAAHERVLFERYMSQTDGTVLAQTLLEAVTVELPPASTRLLNKQLPILKKLGFEVEVFGKGTFIVRAIPELLAGMDPEMALGVIVDDFEEDETPLEEQIEAKIVARICKRAAVKAGQVLNHQEQLALLQDLESCEAPRTCPHGRPTMIHLSVDLLERQFGRKGAR